MRYGPTTLEYAEISYLTNACLTIGSEASRSLWQNERKERS
jgi:hypothetical protein